ncbi:MAG TPA: OsmC family protein [Burkholderiales bacterium]|nr:OsmC family protein [Burkholderiales bacterium]
MQRNGSAVWKGGLKDGSGQVSTGSGGLASAPYTFASRFESGGKTDPEELVAAAHAACFSMALSGQLGQANLRADSIATTASLNLDKTDAGMTVTAIHLVVKAKVPGADKAVFEKAAGNAKAGCPISRLLNAKITLEATLE